MSEKILIVDNDKNFINNYRGLLSKAGFQVLTASNGKEALSTMLTHQPDLVLLDIFLPIINGFDLLEKMHQHPKLGNIPIIVITNLVDKDEEKIARNLGVKDYLIKERYSPEQVVDKINKAFLKN